MQNHVNQTIMRRFPPQTVESCSIIFRELFCIAANNIAGDLETPFENIGILFDEIITTGQKCGEMGEREIRQESEANLEKNGTSCPVIRAGQLLLLVNKVCRRKAADLEAKGYRFTMVSNVLTILARNMHVDRGDLSRQLQAMSEYVDGCILEKGIYLACFVIRPSIQGEFDVLVCSLARNQLPTVRLPTDSLNSWQVDYLKKLDWFSVAACIKYLCEVTSTTVTPIEERLFAIQLLETLKDLTEEIAEPFINDALLVAKAIRAPCRGFTKHSQPRIATFITFTLLAPIRSLAKDSKYQFTPFSFFKTQQHVYKNSLDHAIFTEKTYREFALILDLDTQLSVANNSSGRGGVEMETVGVTSVKDDSRPISKISEESETFADELFKICIGRR
jgi:hypothetical protein